LKTLLTNIQAALREKLPYIRPADIYITPHENFIPAGVQFPAVGIKDGNIKSEVLMGGDLSDRSKAVRLIPYVKMFDGEKSVIGHGADKGILEVAEDIKDALKDNFLGISGMEDVTCTDEKASESFGEPGDGLVRKIIIYVYEIREDT